MSTAVLLTTMRCNIECAHCSVDAHPYRSERMPLDAAMGYLRQLAATQGIDHVDLSGGEPLVHLEDVKALAGEARRLGVSMRVTTNGSWAGSPDKARRILSQLKQAGLDGVGVSIDEWHLPFVSHLTLHHYIDACREIGFQPYVSAVVRGTPSSVRAGQPPPGVAELFGRYQLDPRQLVDAREWELVRAALPREERDRFDADTQRGRVLYAWQILTEEGRARALAPVGEPFGLGPSEACPAAGDLPTIDADGQLYPCCSPWTSRKEHSYGVVGADGLGPALERMRRSALVRLIHASGPERLILALQDAGIAFAPTHSGICNQCGQLFDRFTLAELEAAAAHLLDLERNTECYRLLQLAPRASLMDRVRGARPKPPATPRRVIMMVNADAQTSH